ncbi:hypothetical protein AVEN_72463-1 [Araneus ventricosus]|uniref:HTH psq-type domain-containing protein n=1 Tax=Araneus ventricosus TaxID=182803 RepID=A0A4Y2SIG9_ARAVE|nr:hypothetical protein AVEN_72463-1 [Araneus ventricosus]
MSGVKRKRNVLNVKQKLEILQKLDNGESASTDAEDVLKEGNTISHSAALQSVEILFDYMGQRGFDYGDITAVRKRCVDIRQDRGGSSGGGKGGNCPLTCKSKGALPPHFSKFKINDPLKNGSQAEALLNNIESFQFIFCLLLIQRVLEATDTLSKALQSKSLIFLTVKELVNATK